METENVYGVHLAMSIIQMIQELPEYCNPLRTPSYGRTYDFSMVFSFLEVKIFYSFEDAA